ncbi:CDP-alcohol phosphatidyltransferase family protein [Litorilinea aerophila]|uniref:CDP-alcohol phosphatidyltransferase family protein n=1 Tax=Litorilinea aerophila TaxID=1204385 RepID=A0A540VMI7_9CHLR|nr:CDP-alcohol phosphatidyltransferase family protein [Litorilinea aerophila]MCC9075034.1 CDP-alcohol phosphatidyltransferase family protein [Litorilinea aerophila]GIV79818.1 MAG: CDP-diacylglycerol--inositol 3-phosphatidyltransferase [Litorilinea sp.]
MLSKYGRQLAAEPLARLVDLLHRWGVTPNGLTYFGFILTVGTALVLAGGYFRLGAILLLFAALFDMLDGSLARLTHQSSTFGAFLDSTLDRYSESVTFLALAYYYSTRLQTRTELVLIFVILVGSLMVSYTRARAEALKVECKAGILQRPERVVLLILGLFTGWMLPILWILAIFTNFTALQRIYEVYWRTNQPQAPVANHVANSKVVKPNDNWPVQG